MATFPETLDIRVRLAPDDAMCIDCRWWKPTEMMSPQWGFCQRRAPVKQSPGELQWPVTRADDLCGEWEAKP